MKQLFATLSLVSLMVVVSASFGEEGDESSVSVNGYLQAQSGVFVPLALDGIFDEDRAFQDHKNRAYNYVSNAEDSYYNYDEPCDPAVVSQKPCRPLDHGGRAGDASMMRATFQLEIDWAPLENINVHAIMRGVHSLALNQDYWAQPPDYMEPGERSDWVSENIYNGLDLRELYLDFYPADWLSLRIGRQQVTWGQTGQFRLLDVINPSDTTWHFGSLEEFRDTRIPLWIAKALIGFESIRHDLELVWVPGVDRHEDSVTVPLSFVGAWGVPYTNTPSSFEILERKFLYPSRKMPDSMRAGLRWKGDIGYRVTYSLVYYYTHQISPPVPAYFDLKPEYRINSETGMEEFLKWDSETMETLYLIFPRQHIAGLTLDYSFESPISMVAQFEGSVEPDRTYSRILSDSKYEKDLTYKNPGQRYLMNPVEKLTINYAVRLLRPTMIRALNQSERFQFGVQWMHTIIPNVSKEESRKFIVVPGYSNWGISTHSWTLIGFVSTKYLHGTIAPQVIVAYVHPNSGFVTASVNFKAGDHWRFLLSLTDFFGEDPYKNVGLFRDRDEVNLRVRFQF